MDLLTYFAMRSVWALLSLLPLPLVMGIAKSIATVAWWLLPNYRRLVRRNLSIAFGDAMTSEERNRIGRKHFASLASNIAAGACLASVPAERLGELVTVDGLEHLREAQRKGNGVIGLLAHLGNWELLARLSPGLFLCPCGSVYQSLSNRHVDSWVRRARASEGLELFERKEGFHGAMNLLRRGGVVGVLADQHAGDGGLWCPLFNRLASTSPLVATMALRTGAAVLGIALYTEPGCRWRLVIRPEAAPEQKDTAAFTARLNLELESMIRKAPADWLWSHNRWKTPNPRFLAIGGKRGLLPAQGLQSFRLLIRSVNWLGDAVMTVPAIRAIRRTRPDLEITVACQEKLVEFWRAVPEVDRVLPLPIGRGIRATARLFETRQFDAALVFPNSLRAGLEVWLAGIPRRVGYPGHFRSRLLNCILPKKNSSLATPAEVRHQVHHYLDLAEFIGAPRIDSDDWVARRVPLTGAGVTRPWRIAICPGAEFGPAKRWFPERYAQVMREVTEVRQRDLNQRVIWLLVGVAKDAPVGAEIQQAAGGCAVENLIGNTGLQELISVLNGCDLLVTNDTGTMHLGALLGLPLAAVFGSTEPLLTGPLGPGKIILQHRVPCGPCFRRECHLDFACMQGVSSASVVSAVLSLMDQEFCREKGSPAEIH
jgi:lipopolysaccharide heptosyltransferase II